MSSFFSVPGGPKKRKRTTTSEAPKKRLASTKSNGQPARKPRVETKATRDDDDDEISSGSESDGDSQSFQGVSEGDEDASSDEEGSDEEAQTAAERRLRLAERYLENVKEHVDEAGFDAAEIDRDLIAERLQEDVAESKGRVYRQLASELDFEQCAQTFFRTNTNTVTSIAAHDPYVYTVTKDLYLHKWKVPELPQHQWPQTTRRKLKKAPAPPRRRPELVAWLRGNAAKSKEKYFKRHTGTILAVAASPDGRYVVTGGADRKIIVYEAQLLKPVKVLTHHRDAVTGLVFRRGTNQLYSSSKDRTVKVWSLDEMAYVETLFGHQDEILDIDALAQERCVSVGARDRTARLWKVIEETQLVFRGGGQDKKSSAAKLQVDPRSLLNEGSMDRVAMIDDDLFVTGSDNGSLALWSVQKKKPLHIEPIAHGVDPALSPLQSSAEKHPDPDDAPAPTPRWITALATIPYSDVIISGSWDSSVRLWKLSEDKKRIEAVGNLQNGRVIRVVEPSVNGDKPTHNEKCSSFSSSSLASNAIKGVVNDIAVFERGDRGSEGLCIVAAVGQDHRFGRWKTNKSVRNGGVVFEMPRKPATAQINGKQGASEDEESA